MRTKPYPGEDRPEPNTTERWVRVDNLEWDDLAALALEQLEDHWQTLGIALVKWAFPGSRRD